MTETFFRIFTLIQPGPEFIDSESIREIVRSGIEDLPFEDRASAWLVFLEIFPNDPNKWTEERQRMKNEYNSYKEIFNILEFHNRHVKCTYTKHDFSDLNAELMTLIHGDVIRTCKHIFKLPEYQLPGVEISDAPEQEVLKYEFHLRRIERVLYLFASLNPTMSYMQGFNELLMPIYYTLYMARSLFCDDPDEVECLSFFCLHQLITKTLITDLFTTQDKSSILLYRLKPFVQLLQKHTPRAHKIIQQLNIHPVCYCFRWFSLLFCQEFEIPKLLTIWDSLLLHFNELVEYAYYIGVVLVKLCEDSLSVDNYGETISNLQFVKEEDVKKIVKMANDYWNHDRDPSLLNNVWSAINNAGSMMWSFIKE